MVLVCFFFFFYYLRRDRLVLLFRHFQETPAGRKAAHREGKLRMKREKLARENVAKKVTPRRRPSAIGNYELSTNTCRDVMLLVHI